ncbi:hypothetical protein MNB_SV-8-177 [hydrothermal vent metagenome]|uniref:Uncharacterized protein n=1 Tax=hydrothermal vent metagenome TaxID=652676 RepID=A0A1W1CB06_9ZZZZ
MARADNPRPNQKAGDPTVKPVCCEKYGNEIDKKVKDACGIDPKENQKFKEKQKKIKQRREKYNKKHPKHKKSVYEPRDMTWKDKHCGPVLYKYELPSVLEDSLKTVKEEVSGLKDDMEDMVKEIVTHAGVKKVERVLEVGACSAIGAALGGAIGFFFGGVGAAPGAALGAAAGESLCGAAATAEGVVDAVEQSRKILEIKEQYLDKFKKELKNIKKLQELAKRGQEIAKLNAKEKLSDIEKETLKKLKEVQKRFKNTLYSVQERKIKKDPCLKSKRCELKSFSEQNKGQKSKSEKLSPKDKYFGLASPNGCCPGQTPHHIIPDTKIKACNGYNKTKHYNDAPTVCVEGSKDTGTHGKMHTATDDNAKNMVKKRSLYKHSSIDANSMKGIIEASSQAFVSTFSYAHCKKECIKEKLEKAYKDLDCKGVIMAKSKGGQEIKRRDENSRPREGL